MALEGKVGRLEEAELAVDVRTGGEGGAGGSGELLACVYFGNGCCLCRDVFVPMRRIRRIRRANIRLRVEQNADYK